MKKIAWLLSFVLIFSVVFENVSLRAAAENTIPGNVEISIQNNQSGKVYYQLDGNSGSWTEVTSSTFTLRTTDELNGFTSGRSIYLKAVPEDGQSLDEGVGKNTLNAGSDPATNIAVDELKNGTYSFEYNGEKAYNIQISFAGSTNPPQNNGGLRLDITKQDSATGTITYTFLNTGDESLGTDTVSESTSSNIAFPVGVTQVNIKINLGENSQVTNYGVYVGGNQMASETDKANAVGTSGHTFAVSDLTAEHQVQVEFATDPTGGDPIPTEAISFFLEGDAVGAAIQKGAVQYSTDGGNSWTTVTSALVSLDPGVASAQIKVTDNDSAWNLQSFDIPNASVITSGTAYPVTEKKQYHIQIDKKVYTVVWTYDPESEMAADAFVEHGKVQIISAVAAGQSEQWSGIEPTDMPGANNNQQDATTGGRVAIIPGSTVTVKIVPNYKYQFIEGKLNDTILTPDVNNVSTFTFTMPETNLRLTALFVYTEDQSVISAAGVSGATITGGEKVIDSGNLELTVKDFTDESKKTSLQASDAAS